MSTIRRKKVAMQASKVLAALIVNKAKDARFKFVNISEVEISPDLAYAKVYVNFWGIKHIKQQQTDENTILENETIIALNKAAPWFQKELGKQLQLRKILKIRFIIDPVPQQSAEIDSLLKTIQSG